jgi:hypothetical protein
MNIYKSLIVFSALINLLSCDNDKESTPKLVESGASKEEWASAILWSQEEPESAYERYLASLSDAEKSKIEDYGRYSHIVYAALKGDEFAFSVIQKVQAFADASASELNIGIIKIISKE